MAVFLGIEFLDELVDGALSAAWPLLRSELALSYTQIGLLVGLMLWFGFGWRPAFLGMAAMAAVALIASWMLGPMTSRGGRAGEGPAMRPGDPDLVSAQEPPQPAGNGLDAFAEEFRRALAAGRRGAVLRWLVLLEFADLMLDVFRGYLALYFVEVVAAGQRMAGLAVAGLTGAHLAGAALLLPLLGRLTGSAYLRASAVGVLVTLPAFLFTPHPEAELALVVLLGLFTSGWYPVLKAKLYEALPGQSGTAMTLGTLSGLLGGLLPVALGRFAEAYGLGATLWWLLAGPVALLAGVPLRGRAGRAGGDAEPDGAVEPVGRSGGGHGDDHDGDRGEGWKRKG